MIHMERNAVHQALEKRIAGTDTTQNVRTLEQVGGIDQVRTVVREQRTGYGKLKRRVETWQDLSKVFQYNQKLRDGQLPDHFIKAAAGQRKQMYLDAVVPRLVYQVWRDQYGFDLLKADLSDPVQLAMYEKLISAPELKGIVGAAVDPRNCRVYHSDQTQVMISKKEK